MTENPLHRSGEPDQDPTLREIKDHAESVNLTYISNTDFRRNLKRREGQHRVVFEAVKEGLLTIEDGAFLTASLHAETDIETEIDARTGLYKDHVAQRRLREDLRMSALVNEPVSVAFVDLDDFGKVNKAYSQDHGDAVLGVVGEYLRRNSRATDTVGRRGGEEILIVMPGIDEVTMRQRLLPVFDFMPEYVADAIAGTGFAITNRITASVGVANVLFDSQQPSGSVLTASSNVLINTADRRMNIAKAAGKNRVFGTAQEKTWRRDVYAQGKKVVAQNLL